MRLKHVSHTRITVYNYLRKTIKKKNHNFDSHFPACRKKYVKKRSTRRSEDTDGEEEEDKIQQQQDKKQQLQDKIKSEPADSLLTLKVGKKFNIKKNQH